MRNFIKFHNFFKTFSCSYIYKLFAINSNLFVFKGQLALKAIDYLEWKDYFSSFQIHPGTKVIHMNDIKFDLKLDKFSDVLFFDDDHRNIIELNAIGVRAHQLNYETGLDINEMINGLNMFQQ